MPAGSVLRIPAFRKLWIGLGLSSLGDWMGLLALTAMANMMVEGYAAKNYAIAGVLFLRVLPALVVGPLAGYVADHLDRKNVLIWGDYLRGCAVPEHPAGRRAVVGLRGHGARRDGQPGVAARQGRHRAQPGASAPAGAGQPDQHHHDVRLGGAGGGALLAADRAGPGRAGAVRLAGAGRGRRRALPQRAVVHRLRHRDRGAGRDPAWRGEPARRGQPGRGDRARLEVRRADPRGARAGLRHGRCLRRGRCRGRAVADLRGRPRRRRRRVRRAVRRGVRRHGAGHVAGAAAARPGQPAAGVRRVPDRHRAGAGAAGAGAAPGDRGGARGRRSGSWPAPPGSPG